MKAEKALGDTGQAAGEPGALCMGQTRARPEPCLRRGPEPRSSPGPSTARRPRRLPPGCLFPNIITRESPNLQCEALSQQLRRFRPGSVSWREGGSRPLRSRTRSLRGVWEGRPVRWSAENGVYRVSEPLGRCFSTGKFRPPGDLWQCLETVLVFTACREEMVLVASGGQEPAIQLNGPRDKRFSGPETPTAPRPCCL